MWIKENVHFMNNNDSNTLPFEDPGCASKILSIAFFQIIKIYIACYVKNIQFFLSLFCIICKTMVVLDIRNEVASIAIFFLWYFTCWKN